MALTTTQNIPIEEGISYVGLSASSTEENRLDPFDPGDDNLSSSPIKVLVMNELAGGVPTRFKP